MSISQNPIKAVRSRAFLLPNKLETDAILALVVGVIAGGAAIARKWNAADERGFQEAVEGGKTWDVYEQKRQEDALDPEVAELRAERQARRERLCGRSDSGKTPAERSDSRDF